MKPAAYIPTIVILASILLASSGAYVYALSEIARMAAEEGELTDTAALTAQRDSDTRATVALLKETETDRASLASRVIGPDSVASFLELVEKQGKVSIVSVALAEGGWTHHEIARVTFTADGSFESLAALLGRLESMPYAMRIERAYFELSGKSWIGSFTVAAVKKK